MPAAGRQLSWRGLPRKARGSWQDPGDCEACSSQPSAANLISALFGCCASCPVLVNVVMAVAAKARDWTEVRCSGVAQSRACWLPARRIRTPAHSNTDSELLCTLPCPCYTYCQSTKSWLCWVSRRISLRHADTQEPCPAASSLRLPQHAQPPPSPPHLTTFTTPLITNPVARNQTAFHILYTYNGRPRAAL